MILGRAGEHASALSLLALRKGRPDLRKVGGDLERMLRIGSMAC